MTSMSSTVAAALMIYKCSQQYPNLLPSISKFCPTFFFLPVPSVVCGAQSVEHFDTRYYVTLLSGAELELPINRQEPEANQSKQAMM